MSKKTSIIITVDNHFSLVNNFYEHLLNNVNLDNCEIVTFLDGCNHVDVIQYLHDLEREYSLLRVVGSSINLGYGIANNEAVTHAQGEYLLFINSDVFPEFNAIQELISCIEKSDEFSIVQGLLLYPQSNTIQSTGHVFGQFFNRHALAHRSLERLNLPKILYRQSLTSAFYILPKVLFTTHGGFDPFYFNCWDGMEFALKVNFSGLKTICLTTSIAYHSTGGARDYIQSNETQQSAYFWSQWGSRIIPDLVELYKSFDFKFTNLNYVLLNCSYIRQVENYLYPLGLNFDEGLAIHNRFGKPINLYYELPFSYLTLNSPLLFFTNKFTDLSGNKNWIKTRNNSDDVILDTHGNITKLIDFLK